MLPTHDELKQALSRKQPSADFTVRLMDQVHAEKDRGRTEPRIKPFPLKRWTIVGAIAASLTVGLYVRHQRRAGQPAVSSGAAELRAEQLLESLQLAGFKINQAREAVFESPVEESQ